MVPVNIYTYFMNLTEANLNDKPDWKILHDFKHEYGLKDLSPSQIQKLTERMQNEKENVKSPREIANRYEHNKNRRATTSSD